MSNGYGGSHKFDYAADDSAGEYYWHRQVTAARVMDGLGNTSTTAYAYADRCVGGFKDQYGTIQSSPCQDYGEVFFGANTVPQIIGFGSVVETIYNNGALNGSVAHKFNVTDPRLAGREYETRRRDGAGTVLQARQTDEEAATGLSGQPAVVYVARTRETREYPLGDIGSAPMKRTRTDAFTALGSPKTIQEYGFGGTGDDRTTFLGYAPGPIAGELPVWEALYTGILTAEVASPARLSSTRLYYDYAEAGRANTALSGFNVLSQTPARGRLTAVEHGLAAFGAGFPPALWTMANYGYDRIGNVTVLTDAGLNVSSVNYDNSGQFVLGSHNALGQATNYAYYGINGESLTNTVGAAQPYGALKSTTAPNGATVMYAYDALGRLRKVAQPCDTLANPSEEWRYYDGIEMAWTTTATGFSAGPYLTDHLVRGVSGGGWASSTLATSDRTLYDGLGRVIQTQTRAGQGWAWANCNDNPRKTLGAEVIQSTLYDALGRAAIQTVPYTQTQYEYCTTAGRVNTPYVAVPQTAPSGTGLNAVYYNGMNFETAVLNRTDATLNFDWGNGSPISGVSSDHFSARWTGWVRVDASATYTLYAAGDDGIRLWINGQLVVDQWHVQGLTEYAAVVALQAGVYHELKFEYYENDGGAQARLKWASPTVSKQVISTTNLYVSYPAGPVTPTVPHARTGYDALGRPITVTAPDGSVSVTRYGVDANGPGYTGTNLALKTSIDPNGHQKQQVSDGLGRLVRVREFDGTGSYTLLAETRYYYDAADRLTSVTDALGNVTTIRYDGLGRKIEMFDPDMGAWRYGYNALGQLITQTDALGQTLVFTYDGQGRGRGQPKLAGQLRV